MTGNKGNKIEDFMAVKIPTVVFRVIIEINPEDGSGMLPQNVGTHLTVYNTVS
jgi:hypothetical protein